jgi:hypothetical protein
MAEIAASEEINFRPTGRVPVRSAVERNIFHLATACGRAVGSTQLRMQVGGWSSELITHLHPSPRLRMRGAMFISYIVIG